MIENFRTLPFSKQALPQKIVAEALNYALIGRVETHGQDNLHKAYDLATKGATIIVTPNHLSNADAPVLDRAIRESGYKDLADRLVFIQGLKLDRHPLNKFLTKAFKVIKIWPPSLPATNREEEVEKRRINTRARSDVEKSIQAGYHLVVFPEGGRSYRGSLKQGEPSVVHYFSLDQTKPTIVLPVGIFGTEKVLPPHKFPRRSLRVNISFGEPINATSMMARNSHLTKPQMREAVIDEVMRKGIAPLLPTVYRGVYS